MKTPRQLLLALASLSLCAPLQAGDADAMVSIPTTEPVTEDAWEFAFSPYIWGAGLSGEVGIGNVVSDIDLSFGDILENLEIGLMGQFEARKGRWGFLFEGFWIRMEADGDTPGRLYGGADVEVDEVRLAAQISYRALEGPTTLDLFAGLSYFGIDTDLSLKPGVQPGVKLSTSEDWFDPMIGFRLRHLLNERWFTLLRGEIGGFGVGSDLTWQIVGGVGYNFSDTKSITLGYRHLVIDFEDSDFLFDTETSGLFLGMTFVF